MQGKVLFHTETYLNGDKMEWWIDPKFIVNDKDPDFEFDTVYIPSPKVIKETIDNNQKRQNETTGKWSNGEGVVYANFPRSMLKIWQEQYNLQEGFEHTEEGLAFICRLLDSPDYNKFRVYTGKIGNALTHKEI